MSKWLRSVNNLLEKLDDGTAAAAEVAGGTATAARRFLSSSRQDDGWEGASDDDYEDYEDDEGYGTGEDDESVSEDLASEMEEEDESSNRDGEGNGSAEASSEAAEDGEEEVDFEPDGTSSHLFAADGGPSRSSPQPQQQARSLPPLPRSGDPEHARENSQARFAQAEGADSQERFGLLASEGVASSYRETPLEDATSLRPAAVPAPPTSKPRAVPPPPAPTTPPLPPPPAVTAPPSSSGAWSAAASASSASAAAAGRGGLKTLQDQKKALAMEVSRLQAANASLRERLDRAESEVRAQHDELMAAAASLQEERKLLKEEKDEYLVDHEEEIELRDQQHQEEVQKLHAKYQSQIKGLQDDLKEQRALYMKQGGDFSSEVGKALEEKGRAVEEANDSRAQREALQAQHDELARRHESLQRQCASLEQSAELARQAERHAEEKLDASLEHHKHQVALRQAREAELERTVAELGAALTAAQSSAAALTSHSHPGLGPTDGGPSRESLLASLGEYKEKCAAAAEELESAKTELRMMAREREALQRDVKEMSAERDAEAAQAQERQLRHDEQLSQLTAQLQRLQGNATRESSNGIGHAAAKDGGGPADPPLLRQTELELGESRRQIAELSDQLLRLRGIAEASKSEVLALKGRLQAANSRADAAEVALASATTSAYDVEGGGGGSGSKSRRRVKGGLRAFGGGGLSRPSHLAPRSVRAALGLRVVSGSTMEQVALTVDAIDNWMMDTGSILKAEPLARVAFAAYLAILHCWCFALVFFHAVESEHGDLGVLTHRGGPLHPGKK